MRELAFDFLRAKLCLPFLAGHWDGRNTVVDKVHIVSERHGRNAGIARENVSRALKDWTEHGMVSRLAGYYCLEKKDAIQNEAEPTA